jgi:hypothetical protein
MVFQCRRHIYGWQENQPSSAQYDHRNQEAENTGKDRQPQQFSIRLQDGETVSDKLPSLSNPTDVALPL